MYRKLLGLLLLSAILSGTVFASNGTQIGTVGARGIAMGSNFRGMANDWTAFFFNPGGLNQLNGLTIGVSGGMIMPRGSYTPYAFPGAPWDGLYTDEREAAPQNFFVPSFGIFYQFSENITAGVGFYAPFGLGAKFDLFQVPAGYQDTPLSLAEVEESQSDHQVAIIQPTLAIKLAEGLSIGGGFGYAVIGEMQLRQIAVPEFGKIIAGMGDAQTSAAYQGLVGLYKGLGVYNDAHDRVIVETFLDGSGHAFALNFGAHYKPSESFSIGASIQYYTDLKLQGTMSQTTHMPGGAATYIPAASAYFAQVPGAQTIDSLTTILGTAGLFGGGSEEKTFEAEANLPLPMTVGVGIALKPIDRLTIVADGSWTRWAAWDVIEIQLADGYQTDTREMVQDWESTFQVGAGFELNLLNTDMMGFDLRAGFYWVDTPAPFTTISPLLLDPNDRTVISAGFGFRFSMFTLNFAYERVMLEEQNVQQFWYHFSDIGINENWAGRYNMSANVFTADLSVSL